MQRASLALATLVALACGARVAPAQPPAAPNAAPGWTGATAPETVIAARRALMAETERQIKPIDLYTVGTPAEPAALRSAAATIEALLLALPHLFPPTTNLFDASASEPPTLALPAVWQRFAAFQAMAENAQRAAAALVAADGDAALATAARELRATCDACHQAFAKPYLPPQAVDEDRDFDFEQFLPK